MVAPIRVHDSLLARRAGVSHAARPTTSVARPAQPGWTLLQTREPARGFHGFDAQPGAGP